MASGLYPEVYRFSWNCKCTDCDPHLRLVSDFMLMKVTQLCPTLCHPMDCSPTDSSFHGILQARILEWVAISFSRGIFLTQGSNLGLLHCRQTLYPSELPGKPFEPVDMLQEGGPLPGPKTGLLSNTRKWTVQGDTCADKARDFIGKEHPGGEQ